MISHECEVEELLAEAKELTAVPWESITIPSYEMYFKTPTTCIKAQMTRQITAILLQRLAAIVQEKGGDILDDCSASVLLEMRTFISFVLDHYSSIHYHSCEHALHVTLNSNKLLSLVLEADQKDANGIKKSALMQFAFIFAALIHDVEHLGVTNYFLSKEAHALALTYNDQSMLEQQSLSVAFKEFMRPCYSNLRNVLFATDYEENYNLFRRLVVDLVLCTDTASPERMHLTKSKYDQAFTVETSKPWVPFLKNFKKLSVRNKTKSIFRSKNDKSTNEPSEKPTGEVNASNRRKSEYSSRLPENYSRDIVISSRRKSESPRQLNMRMSLDYTGLIASQIQVIEQLDEAINDDTLSVANPDDNLKAQAILELLIRAADVGSTMQTFAAFTRWGRRLYFEYKTSFEVGRGFDPEPNWFDSQVQFLEHYAKPLAQSMEDSQVFSKEQNTFVRFAEENKKKWKEFGYELTCTVLEDWLYEKSLMIEEKKESFP